MADIEKQKMSRKLWDFIRLLSQPPADRNRGTMADLLPWLRKRCQVLRGIEAVSLLEIMKNSSYFGVQKHEVIFMQGQPRQRRFFIVLRGSCSMYVNPFLNLGVERARTRMSGASGFRSPEKVMMTSSVTPRPDRPDSYVQIPGFDDDLSDISDYETEISFGARADTGTMTGYEESPTLPTPVSKKGDNASSRFGRFVVSYEKGRYFGEGAILTEDRMCTATMVANEDCDFLIIPDEFFQHCVREHYEREVTEQFDFVDTHPFFKNFSERARNILQISIRKDHFNTGAFLARQGEPLNRLFFVVSGSVELTVDPKRHKGQYPQLWPFETSSDLYYREFEWLRDVRRKAYQEKYIYRGETTNRRKLTESEKDVHLCTIQSREALGIIELIMNLSSYIQSARCTSDTEVYVLNLKTFKRIVNPKKASSEDALSVMRAYTQLKLEYRVSNPTSDQVPLLKCLFYEYMKENRQRSLKVIGKTKQLEKLAEREKQLLEALEWFKQGKAPLVLQRDPSVIKMKEKMKKKAQVRENVKKSIKDFQPYFRRGCRQMKVKREPRSIHQLRIDPFENILLELEKSGIWKTPQELEDFLLNYSRTPDEVDIRTQTNQVTEGELHLVRLRRQRNRLVRRFVKLMEHGEDPVGLTHEEAIMCHVLFDHVNDMEEDWWKEEPLPVVSEDHIPSPAGRKSIASSYKTFRFHEKRGATPRTLDMRIKDFHYRYGACDKDVKHLPILRRYREIEAEESPKPGGKVFVTKVPCLSCQKKVNLKDHKHEHCQMLNFIR